MKRLYAGAVSAEKAEVAGILLKTAVGVCAVVVEAVSPEEAEGMMLKNARSTGLPSVEGYSGHEATVKEIPQDLIDKYATKSENS